jgi:hypothetical protein
MSQTRSDLNTETSSQKQTPDSVRRLPTSMLARVLTVAAIFALIGVIAVEARGLWAEWSKLQNEIVNVNHTSVIGYRDIAPVVSYAAVPSEWFRRDGNQALLWAGWEAGVGHKWFRFPNADIDRSHVVKPATAMFSRAIDYPVVEVGDGQVWQRVPLDSQVVGYKLQGVECVYPVLVLGKVQVVNDIVDDHPFMVVANPFAAPDKAFAIYDANHDGHRLTMAPTGYFHDGRPLLFDRATKSLWVDEDDSLKAIAGTRKRARLNRIANPMPVTWKTWLNQNRSSRLLVGADRTRGIPVE